MDNLQRGMFNAKAVVSALVVSPTGIDRGCNRQFRSIRGGNRNRSLSGYRCLLCGIATRINPAAVRRCRCLTHGLPPLIKSSVGKNSRIVSASINVRMPGKGLNFGDRTHFTCSEALRFTAAFSSGNMVNSPSCVFILARLS